MMARMPVRSATSSSERSKPSRLSISSWFRIRSEPASASASPPPPFGQASATSAAAGAAASTGSGAVSVSSAMGFTQTGARRRASVDQHLLDEDGVGAAGRDHQVHPPQDLHAQLVGALAAREVLGPQLA